MELNKPQQTFQIQLCVFDSSRDYPEGEEAKRILAYYPTGCASDEQTAVVGLAEALVTFAGNFDENEACSGMLSERSRWTFHTPEQHISMIMVTLRRWLAPNIQDQDLQRILQQLYTQFLLLYGPLRPLLDTNPSAAKTTLQDLLNETAVRLLCAKSSDLAALQSPLCYLYGVPWMPLEGKAFAATHSFASQLGLLPLGSGQSVQEVMLLHEQYCIWSSLTQQDTTALYQLASCAMMVAAKRPSIAKRIAKATGSNRSRNAEAPPHPVHNYKAWVRHQSGFLGLVSQDGEAGPEAELAVPTLHIQSGNEQVGLLGYLQGNMLLLMLLSQPGPVSISTQESVLQTVQAPLRKLDSHLKEHLSSNGNFHVPGFRYLYVDHMLAAVQASPQSKINTLSRGSLALMASARSELQSMNTQQADREVVARGAHDCWVVAKHRNGRELYVVLEGRGEIGLSGAFKLAAQFSSDHVASLGM